MHFLALMLPSYLSNSTDAGTRVERSICMAAGNTGASSCKEVTSRGAWKLEEDQKLEEYVLKLGAKRWNKIAVVSGLNRSGKSCRLRWLTYLRPGIKRGNMSEDEEDLILRLHKLLGNRWSLIAGRLPGRTDNEIKNYWNFHLKKRVFKERETNNIPSTHETRTSLEKEPTTNINSNHECHVGNPDANQINDECHAGNPNPDQINEADNYFDWSPNISDCPEWVDRLLEINVEQWLHEDMDILN